MQIFQMHEIFDHTRQRTGLVFKRSIVGKLEGPKPDIDLIKYNFTSDNIIYE
ncbi:hypothetical protein [Sulfolobus sp. E11-6]|uniref:hypothetical protein n=1 Tax=Sulfolobus sp. E11-6 TaxID=2663020 RepID=UPI0012976F84|nr:hypothetical protein [Sulfolobus sp. E11-6]QGA68185.1 hypothetical protein GFS33_04885 [Sulfolobus sp. E11-6]